MGRVNKWISEEIHTRPLGLRQTESDFMNERIYLRYTVDVIIVKLSCNKMILKQVCIHLTSHSLFFSKLITGTGP